MIVKFSEISLSLIGATLICALSACPALALDNLEPASVLNQTTVQGSFVSDKAFTDNDMTTSLLSVCCPNEDGPGSISYRLDAPQKIAMCVYDQNGHEVLELVDRMQASGYHRTGWDGCLKDGGELPKGTYFLLMKTDKTAILRRMDLE